MMKGVFPQVIARARQRVGEKSYNLLANNCEHFARACKSGIHSSEQVDTVNERIYKLLSAVSEPPLL